jgi:TatA/E family protein of Tat protein translocase
MPFNIGPFELLLVLILALLILGPGKLPEVGSALGRTIREFRKASTDVEDALRVEPITVAAAAAPVAPAPAAPAPVAPAPVAQPAARAATPAESTTEDSAAS